MEAVGGHISEPSAGGESDFSEPKTYTGQEWYGWNMGNVRNFSKRNGNSEIYYNPMLDYDGFSMGRSRSFRYQIHIEGYHLGGRRFRCAQCLGAKYNRFGMASEKKKIGGAENDFR